MGVKDSLELARQDWFGTRRVRPRRGRLGAPTGPRPTSSSPRARSARGCTRRASGSSRRRLGRARRLHRDRPRQLGAALPHHLGHRPRRARARSSRRVRGGRRRGPRRAPVPPPRRRAHRRVDGAVVGVRGARARPGCRRARRAEQPRRGRRVRAASAGASSWRAAASAATTTSCASTGPSGSARRPRQHAQRRSRPRRRPHARRSPSARARASSTATACGTTSRASTNCDPVWPKHGIRILPGPSSAVVRRDRAGACPVPLFPGFDTLGTLEHIALDRPRPLAGSCSPRRSSRRSSRSRAASRTPTSPARASASCCASGSARARPGPVEAFKEHGADFVVADTLDELFDGHARALAPTSPLDTENVRARDRGPRPRARQRVLQGRAAHRHPRRAQLPRRQAHPGGEAAPHPRPEGRAAHRREAARPHPQEPRRHPDRPRLPGARGRRRDRSPACTRSARRRLRRRRRARLPRARGHLPRRLPLHRPRGRAGDRRG